KIAEAAAVTLHLFVSGTVKDLRSAKRVLNRLTEQPTEGVAKEFVGDDVAELHRSAFHGINEANPVDEITFAGSEHFVKLLQLFRWHGEIRVENHQNVAVSLG